MRNVKCSFKLILSVLCVLLVLPILASCEDDTKENPNSSAKENTSSTTEATDIWSDATYKEDTDIGEGSKAVEVEVKVNEHVVLLTVHTDSKTLGDALIDNGIVKGEQGEYVLYIKEVNGITADYNVDASYWAFYQNGEYMNVGIDGAEINGGEHYELVYTKE